MSTPLTCDHIRIEEIDAPSPYCYEDCDPELCGTVEAQKCLDCGEILYRA